MLDLLLVMLLGFLGSFGHCVGMCGPLSVAFSLSQHSASPAFWQKLHFHLWLNLGRIASYTLVGAGIGAIGSVLVAGGQLAGLGSSIRQGLSILTGFFLIWMGLAQIHPKGLPNIFFLHPVRYISVHQKLYGAMTKIANRHYRITPVLLGLIWGLIPCGFLYAAQIKAAEMGNLWQGAITMLAFGLGTLPSMLGVGLSAAFMSADRRSQLFRLGGWVMLLIGGLTILRAGETMTDFSGHGALFCLMITLVARPISRLWAAPLHYRRLFGVSAFILAVTHALHMAQHTLNWNLVAIAFMLPQQQWALWVGIVAVFLMLPAVCTSFDGIAQTLGHYWRKIHLLNLFVLVLGVAHTIGLGSHYLGGLELSPTRWVAVLLLSSLTLGVYLIRLRWVWSLLSLERFYVPAPKLK